MDAIVTGQMSIDDKTSHETPYPPAGAVVDAPPARTGAHHQAQGPTGAHQAPANEKK
jgi:hypothetical protein